MLYTLSQFHNIRLAHGTYFMYAFPLTIAFQPFPLYMYDLFIEKKEYTG